MSRTANQGAVSPLSNGKGTPSTRGIQGCEDMGLLLPILRELDLLEHIDLRRSKLAYAFPDCFCPLERSVIWNSSTIT